MYYHIYMYRVVLLFSALLCAALPIFAQNAPALPADFPKFVDTGDIQADNARYDAAKKAWIEANPKPMRGWWEVKQRR